MLQQATNTNDTTQDKETAHQQLYTVLVVAVKQKEKQKSHRGYGLEENISAQIFSMNPSLGSRKDLLLQFLPNFRLYIIRATKYRTHFVFKSHRTLKRQPYFKEIVKMLPKKSIPMNWFG